MEVDIHSSLHGECISRKCEFISTGTSNLKDHVAKEHPKVHFPCTKCAIVLKSEKDLMSHFNDTHRNRKEVILTKVMQTQTEDVANLCEQCDFSHKDMKVLVKHILDKHCLPTLEFKCDGCDFSADDETFLSLHKINSHEANENMPEKEVIKVFCNALGQMMMNNNELIAKVNKDTNKGMWKLIETTGKLEESISSVKAEIKNIKLDIVKSQENKPKEPKLKKDSGEGVPTNVAAETTTKNKDRNTRRKEQISWIGTSLSKVLDNGKVEKDLDVKLTVSRAYCIKEEANSRFPKSNFKVIVPQLSKKKTLIQLFFKLVVLK